MANDFHVMAKPAGALCNLECGYCFFLHKKELLHSSRIMSETVLENFIRSYIGCQKSGVITFTWQGGEPALAGLDFFRAAVKMQQKYCPPGKYIENDFQTNGTLLTDEWFDFLKQNRFLVGLSVDGPPEIHDLYRCGSSRRVGECAAELNARKIPFNTLTAVNDANSRRPLEVYRYLRDVIRSEHIQFLPVAEPRNFTREPPGYWDWEKLKETGGGEDFVTPWSVRPMEYGKFLTEIFTEWIAQDIGRVCVYTFEALLGAWAGFKPALCEMDRKCGTALALDSDGSLYCCDRFCYPVYRLGNILEQNMAELADSRKLKVFGLLKQATAKECKNCEFAFACRGGCPKNRFSLDRAGEPGLNYLCTGWKYFLGKIKPAMEILSAELRRQATGIDAKTKQR